MGMLQEEQLWRDNAVLRNENKALAERAQIHADMVGKLAERMERAKELLKECEDMLEEYAELGLLETKEVVLMHRISSFLHDGTVKP